MRTEHCLKMGILLLVVAALLRCGGTVADRTENGGPAGTPTPPNNGLGDAGGSVSPPDTCSGNAECRAMPIDCCPPCGRVSRDFYEAMTVDEARDYWTNQCAETSCFLCGAVPDPMIFAACLDGQCEMVDLRSQRAAVACNLDTDCGVRFSACCECSNDDDNVLVAVSDRESYEKLVCDADLECESSCTVDYGPVVMPYCNDGICDLVLPDEP